MSRCAGLPADPRSLRRMVATRPTPEGPHGGSSAPGRRGAWRTATSRGAAREPASRHRRERGSVTVLFFLFFLAVLPPLLVGCAAAGRSGAGSPPLRTTEWVVFQGDSLVATEQVLYYPDRIEGAVDVQGSARVRYVAFQQEASRQISRLEARVFPWQGAGLETEVRVDFTDDSVFVERTRPMRVRQRYAGRRATPYLHPSPGLLEQIVLRASRAPGAAASGGGGDPVEVRVWLVSANTATVARVAFVSSRIADVEIANTSFRAWMDDFGLMLAELPSLGWVIQRRGR